MGKNVLEVFECTNNCSCDSQGVLFGRHLFDIDLLSNCEFFTRWFKVMYITHIMQHNHTLIVQLCLTQSQTLRTVKLPLA